MKPLTFSSTDLSLLQSQLDGWRQRQSGLRRLPPEFWDAASQLARSQGVSLVARTLRIDFYRLQRQARGQRPPAPVKAAANRFIELKLDSHPAAGPEVGLVELIDGPDRRIRIQTGRDPASWIALARSFWRSEP